MTTVQDILEQAKALTAGERKELAKLIIDTLDTQNTPENRPKTGAEIVAMLEAWDDPGELVDSHIEDPVEWVKAQRRKRQQRLDPYRNGDD